jgi:hypothetical protein
VSDPQFHTLQPLFAPPHHEATAWKYAPVTAPREMLTNAVACSVARQGLIRYSTEHSNIE